MSEADKIRSVFEGIENDACHMVLAKNPQSITNIITIMDMEVFRFLNFAEEQFEDDLEWLERAAFVARDVMKMPLLLDPCTQQNEGGARCWMLTHTEKLNKLLNPFGIDFDELREGSLDFNMIRDDPMAPYDPKAAVLFLATLWFLREHHCFSGVSLNVSVLERFHPVQFLQHITFSKRIVTAHLTGVEGIELPFEVCPLVRLLDHTELLTHVSLDRFFKVSLVVEYYDVRIPPLLRDP
ncbi:uncharacterized protein [Dermacentor andersoni]|uniref:uncharacterized protein n=1 Tax=Dermacentor andersoni TaxID=34620 RepID=UPI002416FC2A|nr:uncharacterized protein LOC126526480 [Dermacentor andersoni]